MTVQYDSRIHESANIYTFVFRVQEPLSFIAGQFLELVMDHPNPDERGTRRWFTISSSPQLLPEVRITTRIPIRPSSFKQALMQLEPGDTVQITDIMGDFVLPKNTQKPLAFIVQGIGVTPLGSILSDPDTQGQSRDMRIIYSASVEDDYIWRDMLPHTTIFHKAARSEPLTYTKAQSIIPDLRDRILYVSGSEHFVERMLAEARKKDHPEHRLVGDFFHNYEDR